MRPNQYNKNIQPWIYCDLFSEIITNNAVILLIPKNRSRSFIIWSFWMEARLISALQRPILLNVLIHKSRGVQINFEQ